MTIDLGEVIRKRRKELGMSQSDLAERVGTHRTTIASIERDPKQARLVVLEAIFYELYLEVEWKITADE